MTPLPLWIPFSIGLEFSCFHCEVQLASGMHSQCSSFYALLPHKQHCTVFTQVHLCLFFTHFEGQITWQCELYLHRCTFLYFSHILRSITWQCAT
jgi:hypothetical protein